MGIFKRRTTKFFLEYLCVYMRHYYSFQALNGGQEKCGGGRGRRGQCTHPPKGQKVQKISRELRPRRQNISCVCVMGGVAR